MRVLNALDGNLVRFLLVKRGGKLIRGKVDWGANLTPEPYGGFW